MLPALFKIQKFISVKKEHPNGLKEKSLQLTKKVLQRKRDFFFLRSFTALFEEWMGRRTKTSLCSITTTTYVTIPEKGPSDKNWSENRRIESV